jgi:hypothetical protein
MGSAIEPGAEDEVVCEIELAIALGGKIGAYVSSMREKRLRGVPVRPPPFLPEALSPEGALR